MKYYSLGYDFPWLTGKSGTLSGTMRVTPNQTYIIYETTTGELTAVRNLYSAGQIYTFSEIENKSSSYRWSIDSTGVTGRLYRTENEYINVSVQHYPPGSGYGIIRDTDTDTIITISMAAVPFSNVYFGIYEKSTSSDLLITFVNNSTSLYRTSDNRFVMYENASLVGRTIKVLNSESEITLQEYLGEYVFGEYLKSEYIPYGYEEYPFETSLSVNKLSYEFKTGYYWWNEDVRYNIAARGETRAVVPSLSSYTPDDGSITRGVINTDTVTNDIYKLRVSGGYLITKTYPLEIEISNFIRKQTYEGGGFSSTGGGNGNFGKYPNGTKIESYDVSVDVPSGSTIARDSSTGMYTRYLMNKSYMELLGDWVYDPSLGLSLIIAALENIYGKASDAMISLLSFPFSLTSPLTGITTNQQPLYFGHQPTGSTFLALTSGNCSIDWGTLKLDEYWGNFLDYAPHTKIELFLPWGTGFVPIDPGQCLPGSLKVVTNIEFARGSCVHNIINQDGCVIGTYSGQPGSMVPLISSDIAAKRAGLVVGAVSLAVGGAVAAATPAIAGSVASGAYGSSVSSKVIPSIGRRMLSGAARTSFQGRVQSSAMSAARDVYSGASDTLANARKTANKVASDSSIAAMRHHVEIARNGGFGDANAGMMIQYPYVIISRPEQNVPEDYGHYYGYPSNIYQNLGSLKGYTEVAAIHVDGISATEQEIDELDSLLKGGVIL